MRLPKRRGSFIINRPSEIDILLENSFLIAINKPRCLHSCRHNDGETPAVADRLIALYPHLAALPNGSRDGGLINRLDYFTSGVLLAAVDGDGWVTLRSMTQRCEIEKRYLALVEGLAPDMIEAENFIGSPRRRGQKVYVYPTMPAHGRCSKASSTITRKRYLKQCNCSLVEISLRSGRRHQIRAQCAYLGHSLIGDSLYGSQRSLAELLTATDGRDLDGFLLHAASVSMKHPTAGQVEIFAPSPPIYSAIELRWGGA